MIARGAARLLSCPRTMATKVVEIEGFLVEVSDPGTSVRGYGGSSDDGGGLVLERTGAQAKDVADKVKELRGTIAGVCSYVKSAFAEANHPDELTVKFGIKLAGEVGVPLVSRGTGEASILIEATWKRGDQG